MIWIHPIREKFIIVNVNTVEIWLSQQNVAFQTSQLLLYSKMGKLRLKLSLLIIILHKKITNWTSNTCRIEIVKKDIHFRGSDTATPSHLSTDAIFYANGSSYFCLGQQRNGTVFCSRVIY